MYVYILSEPGLYTVGFYDPSGRWHPDSDHNDRDKAAERVAYLNGQKSNTITEHARKSLENDIYQLLMENPEMDMGEMGNCIEAAESLVGNWIEQNNIIVIE